MCAIQPKEVDRPDFCLPLLQKLKELGGIMDPLSKGIVVSWLNEQKMILVNCYCVIAVWKRNWHSYWKTKLSCNFRIYQAWKGFFFFFLSLPRLWENNLLRLLRRAHSRALLPCAPSIMHTKAPLSCSSNFCSYTFLNFDVWKSPQQPTLP